MSGAPPIYGVVARAGYFYNGVLCYITAIRGSDVCCFYGFVNFDESGVKSESEKGVVNSRLSDFHVCWVRVGANLLSRN